MILRLNDIGAAVGDLQRRLYTIGYTKVEQTNVYDEQTQAVVMQLQQRARLVVDGIYGPKTEAYLKGAETGQLLRQSDIDVAAGRLGVEVAIVLAINEVESRGAGFIKPGYPVILFERHVFWRQLVAHGVDPVPLSKKYPGIVNQSRGGYAGGASEYTRLGVAKQIHAAAAFEAASWGAFQIMGYHWALLGYDSVQAMVAAAQQSEGAHLDMFVRFVLADPALHRALQGKKWATFARLYNGPAYADNLYDVKLARACKRYAEFTVVGA